jgi:hypothetical protein
VITPGLACIWSICSRAGGLTSLTDTELAPAAAFGQPFPDGAGVGDGDGDGDAAAAITALGTDVAVSEPSAFFPVTWTRTVLP